jgi:hypothetical protein
MTSLIKVSSSSSANSNRRKRATLLSPLPEDSDEEETHIQKPPTLEDFLPSEHKIYLTGEDNSIAINRGEDVSADEITVNIGLNGDCYIADKYKERDFVSDDSLIESTDDEEYDTDLEVNEDG